MKQSFVAEVLFYLHIPILAFWILPFFIPLSVWPNRIPIHFWFIISIYGFQTIFGYILHKMNKIPRMQICILTFAMQRLRGHNTWTPGCYNHSFTTELLNRLGVKLNHNGVNYYEHFTVALITIQYLSGWFVL